MARKYAYPDDPPIETGVPDQYLTAIFAPADPLTAQAYRDARAALTPDPSSILAHKLAGGTIVFGKDGEYMMWLDQDGGYHREDGPAYVQLHDRMDWQRHDKLHREDGPAVVWSDGSCEWYHDGRLHRSDGPAVLWSDGRREWYHCGRRHREDGPAVIGLEGAQEWWLMDNKVEPFTEMP